MRCYIMYKIVIWVMISWRPWWGRSEVRIGHRFLNFFFSPYPPSWFHTTRYDIFHYGGHKIITGVMILHICGHHYATFGTRICTLRHESWWWMMVWRVWTGKKADVHGKRRCASLFLASCLLQTHYNCHTHVAVQALGCGHRICMVGPEARLYGHESMYSNCFGTARQ